jgi:hypothetical protein
MSVLDRGIKRPASDSKRTPPPKPKNAPKKTTKPAPPIKPKKSVPKLSAKQPKLPPAAPPPSYPIGGNGHPVWDRAKEVLAMAYAAAAKNLDEAIDYQQYLRRSGRVKKGKRTKRTYDDKFALSIVAVDKTAWRIGKLTELAANLGLVQIQPDLGYIIDVAAAEVETNYGHIDGKSHKETLLALANYRINYETKLLEKHEKILEKLVQMQLEGIKLQDGVISTQQNATRALRKSISEIMRLAEFAESTEDSNHDDFSIQGLSVGETSVD